MSVVWLLVMAMLFTLAATIAMAVQPATENQVVQSPLALGDPAELNEKVITLLAQDSIAFEESLASIKGRIDGLETSLLAAMSTVDKLSKLSVSGYIQARYEWQPLSHGGTSPITPVEPWYNSSPVLSKQYNNDNFYIRRGRVKFTYTANATSKYVLYFDASKDKTSLKEAYVVVTEPWTKHGISLLMGQTNYPFGYEVERSSSVREIPERSKAERTLFPGERDRGLILTVPMFNKKGFRLTADASCLNGTGIDDKIFTWQDPTRRKDYTARVKVELPTFGAVHLDFGGSSYFGDTYIPAQVAAYQITGFKDIDHDKKFNPNVDSLVYKYIAASQALTPNKQRLGGEAQLYYTVPLPALKSGALSFELYKAEDYNPKYAASYGIVKDTLQKGKDPDFGVVNELGFYAMWVTNVTNSVQFAARYDYWDPVSDADTLSLSDKARQKTYTVALNYFWDANVRITAALEVPFFTHKGGMTPPFSSDYNEDYDTRSHITTIQLQYKF
jgi:hypothetical protein